MKFTDYYPLALRTAKRFPTLREDFEHAALGLSTETGEVNTEVKRIAVYGKVMTPEMRVHILEELGDTMWYVPLAMFSHAIDKLDAQPAQVFLDMLQQRGANLKGCGLILSALTGAVAMAATLSDEQYGTRSHRDEIREILTAIVYVVERMANTLGSSGEELRIGNITKLRERFPDAYSDQAAEARADKGGLSALQS